MTWVISQMKRGYQFYWTGAIARNAPKRTMMLAKARKFSSAGEANEEAGKYEALAEWRARQI